LCGTACCAGKTGASRVPFGPASALALFRRCHKFPATVFLGRFRRDIIPGVTATGPAGVLGVRVHGSSVNVYVFDEIAAPPLAKTRFHRVFFSSGFVEEKKSPTTEMRPSGADGHRLPRSFGTAIAVTPGSISRRSVGPRVFDCRRLFVETNRLSPRASPTTRRGVPFALVFRCFDCYICGEARKSSYGNRGNRRVSQWRAVRPATPRTPGSTRLSCASRERRVKDPNEYPGCPDAHQPKRRSWATTNVDLVTASRKRASIYPLRIILGFSSRANLGRP